MALGTDWTGTDRISRARSGRHNAGFHDDPLPAHGCHSYVGPVFDGIGNPPSGMAGPALDRLACSRPGRCHLSDGPDPARTPGCSGRTPRLPAFSGAVCPDNTTGSRDTTG